MMQDGIQTPYTSDWFTISPQFNFRPVSWSNIVYKCTFGRNILELPTTSSSSNRFTQSLEIVFVPTQQLDIKLERGTLLQRTERQTIQNIIHGRCQFHIPDFPVL